MSEELLRRAREAMEHSHSPYSHFRVGAALLTTDGRTFVGTNVENASYGVSMCAERVAVYTAVTAGYRSFSHMVIVTDQPVSIPPCGACRQVMSEFGPLPLSLVSRDDHTVETSVDELLPHAFRPAYLDQAQTQHGPLAERGGN